MKTAAKNSCVRQVQQMDGVGSRVSKHPPEQLETELLVFSQKDDAIETLSGTGGIGGAGIERRSTDVVPDTSAEIRAMLELIDAGTGAKPRASLPGDGHAVGPCRGDACQPVRWPHFGSAVFIHNEAGRPLTQHEDVGRDIAAAGYSVWCVVATRTGVGVRSRDAVEVAGKDKGGAGIQKVGSGALGERSSVPFLNRPVGAEQALSVGDQFLYWYRVFFAVL